MYNKRLVRVTDNVWIAGVCAGVADYFGFDRDTTRIVWLLLTLVVDCGGVFPLLRKDKRQD